MENMDGYPPTQPARIKRRFFCVVCYAIASPILGYARAPDALINLNIRIRTNSTQPGASEKMRVRYSSATLRMLARPWGRPDCLNRGERPSPNRLTLWSAASDDARQGDCLRLAVVGAIVFLTGVGFFDLPTLVLAVGFVFALPAGLALVWIIRLSLACLT